VLDRVLGFVSGYDRIQGPDDSGIDYREKENRAMASVIERKTRGQVRFLRLPEVLARTGLSRSTIYVRLEQGRFPRPVSLGSRAVGWIEAEVDEWMCERIAASRSDEE